MRKAKGNGYDVQGDAPIRGRPAKAGTPMEGRQETILEWKPHEAWGMMCAS